MYAAKPVPFFSSSRFLVFSFLCLFPEAAIFIHTLVPLWLEAGWGSRFLVPVRASAYVFACVCAYASTPVYFQSILFKDQTKRRVINLSFPRFLSSPWETKEGRREKEEGLAIYASPGGNVHIPFTLPSPLSCPPGLDTLLSSPTEADLAELTPLGPLASCGTFLFQILQLHVHHKTPPPPPTPTPDVTATCRFNEGTF